VYSGTKELNSEVDGSPIDAGKLVLSPTRTYAPIVNKVLEQFRNKIDGMVHCSGGAQTKVLHFVGDVHVVKDQLFETPPLFKLIQEESGTTWEEMYKVFNMGHRMEFYTDEATAAAIIEISKSFDVDAKIVGRVEASAQKELSITSEHGTFKYS
jgi:phosphoribosylformylglycinamidine cyclo-ligase